MQEVRSAVPLPKVFAGQLWHAPLTLYPPEWQEIIGNVQSEAALDPAGAVLESGHGVQEVRAAAPLPKVFAGQFSHAPLML